MNSLTMYLIYGLPGLVLFVLHVRRRRRLERQSLKALESTGAAEPASLHPIIDPATCIGCSSCVKACPEQAHRSEEHTSELQSQSNLVCRLLLGKKKTDESRPILSVAATH